MKSVERRTLLTLSAAVVLPLLLFASLQGAFLMRSERAVMEGDALSRVRQANAAIDGRLRADAGALDILATSRFLQDHEWEGARARMTEVQAARPDWRNMALTDLDSGRLVFDTRGGRAGDPPPASVASWMKGRARTLDTRAGRDRVTVDGVDGVGPGCPCIGIHAPVVEGGRARYLLTAEITTDSFQQILTGLAPRSGVSALADREGRFIARTRDYRERVGKPASRSLRAAVARGGGGYYDGATLEGLQHRTAYEVSPFSGWSTHVAIPAEILTERSLAALLLTLLGAGAALLLATVIAVFGLRQVGARRLAVERGAQAQKLAAVGQLASGIAHDFNNLLMVIGMNLERIAAHTADPALEKPVRRAREASDRGAALVGQLMAFTRSQPLEIAPVDLGALLDNLSGLLRQSAGRAVTVEVDVADAARHISSNASQLELALINMAVNARDAMPDGGRLTIRARPTRNRPECIDLSVTDTGEGMPREVLDHAMEPFFTTKPLGKGTGLGLAQVFGIVSQSGGSVDIASTPGAGTTITLTLPRA